MQPARRGFYSVRDVTAFKVLAAVRHELEHTSSDAPAHAAALGAICEAMHRLSEGFHPYQVQHKIERLIEARDRCCAAVAELTYLGRHGARDAALDQASRLERDALGSLRGLLRKAERRATTLADAS